MVICIADGSSHRWRFPTTTLWHIDAGEQGPSTPSKLIHLKRVIKERFGVDYHERHVGTLLKRLGFSHISARPRHPGQNAEIVEAYKKTSRRR